MKIYEISSQIRAIFDDAIVDTETGEITFDQVAFDQVSSDAKDKIANTARFLREEETEIEAMAQVIKSIKERMDTKKRKHQWLSNMALHAVQALGEKVECPDIRVSTRRSESIEVTDNAQLEERFITTKVTREPNKRALKDAVKGGEKINGVTLVTNYSLNIK